MPCMNHAERLRFLRLTHFDRSYVDMPGKVSEPLRAVAIAFVANMRRLAGLVDCLPNTIFWSMAFSQSAAKAKMLAFSTLDPSPEQLASPELFVLKTAEFNAQLAKATKNDPDKPFEMWEVASHNLNALVDMFAPFVSAIEAVLASVSTGCWTAFETLAADLWTMALNLRPDPFAVGAINNQKKRNDEEQSPEQAADNKKNPKLRFIEAMIGSDYAAAREIGNHLRHSGKFDFSGLWELQQAYGCAFGHAEVEKLFGETSFEGVQVLHGVRNVLVHHGGVIDHAYRIRQVKHKAQYERFGLAGLELDSLVPLNGEVVCRFANDVIASARAVLAFVDARLSNGS